MAKEIKKPKTEEVERCIKIRKLSKQGIRIPEEDHNFCIKMFKQYPDWYKKTEARVFNETVPFGSDVRRSE